MSAGVSQTSSPSLERALDDALGSVAVDALERRGWCRAAGGATRLAGRGARAPAPPTPGRGRRRRARSSRRSARGMPSAFSTTASTGFSLAAARGRVVDGLRHLVRGRGHRRDEEDDDGVDLRVLQEERQRRRIGLRGGAAEHVDRVLDAGLRGQKRGERRARLARRGRAGSARPPRRRRRRGSRARRRSSAPRRGGP